MRSGIEQRIQGVHGVSTIDELTMLHVCYLDLFKVCSDGGAYGPPSTAHGVYMNG